jgi:hypothetical protein
MGGQIGFRSQRTPNPHLLSIDADHCREPPCRCARQALADIAIHAALVALSGWRGDFRGLPAGILRVGARAVGVRRDTPPLHPARIAGIRVEEDRSPCCRPSPLTDPAVRN